MSAVLHCTAVLLVVLDLLQQLLPGYSRHSLAAAVALRQGAPAQMLQPLSEVLQDGL